MENKNENAVIRKIQVPLWHKMNLSIDEAAAYSGIGRDKQIGRASCRERV